MFYLPGFMGLLLIKTGELASFGITIELLMLSKCSCHRWRSVYRHGIVGPLGADTSSKVGA